MTKKTPQTMAERFANDVNDHKLTVKYDDGLYRHIRCKSPKNGFYWFDLITWPGYLAFVGDGTGFVFARLPDMFEFFRGSAWNGQPNLTYWAEKVRTDRDSLREYSIELFNEQVAEALSEAEEDYPGVTEAWAEKTEGFYSEYNTEYEHEAREALDRFEFGTTYKASCASPFCGKTATFDDEDEHQAQMWRCPSEKGGMPHRVNRVERIEGFRFYDTSDWNFEDYRWWFVWACHAIIWGIAAYDAQVKAVETIELPEDAVAEEHF